jgi:hypothetical protein
MNYSKIITHTWPHLDEIVAIRLLQKHGEAKFPGIKNAVVTYSSTGNKPENKTWQEHLQEGTVLVGTGGGPFDEHPTLEESRKHGNSACFLVAKALNIDKDPIYKRLIEFVNEADQTGVHELHLANRLKTRYRLNPTQPEKAISLVNDVLDDWEREQQLFVNARAELQQKLQQDPHLKIVAVETANYKMSAAARSLRIPVIIQKQHDGHVQIMCDTDRNNIDLKHVVAAIRKAECLLAGMSETNVATLPETTWQQEGKTPEVMNWFYQMPGQNMLNGTESTPDISPTKIPFSLIIEIVNKHVSVTKKIVDNR